MAQTSEPAQPAGQQAQAMTAERLAEIRERVEAATPGPWYVAQGEFVSQADTHMAICRVNRPVVNDRLRGITRDGGAGSDQPNKEFIAHAPADIAALLADNERLHAELSRAMRLADHHEGGWKIVTEAYDALEEQTEQLREQVEQCMVVVRHVAACAEGNAVICTCGWSTYAPTASPVMLTEPTTHEPDCVFAQARALLASAAAAEAGEQGKE